jgi:protein-S-isoprenylcysteine O-methyltransferase Ste14
MKEKVSWGQRGEWYVAIQFLLFILIFLAPLALPRVVEWPAPWDVIGLGLGIVLLGLGGLMAMAGVLSLGSNLTAVPHPKDDAVFVASGAYRFVRHPIYSGIILGSVGWSLFTHSLLALFLSLVLFIFFNIKSRREEQWLCEKYTDYPAYQKRVRRLIPFIY